MSITERDLYRSGRWLLWFGISLAFLWFLGRSVLASSVLVVVVDDADPWHLRGVGGPGVVAPTLEKIQERGLVFPVVWTSSRCAPSLDQLLTGLRPHESGRTYNSTSTLPDVDPQLSVAHAFQGAGYRTFLAGKFWHRCLTDWGFEAGYDLVQPWEELGRVTQEPVFEWLDALDPGEQFFLYWAPKMPHLPHDAPVEFLDQQVPQSQMVVPGYVDPQVEATWKRDERLFRAMLTWFDDELRKLGKKLRDLGREEDTLVLVVNDNGWAQGIVSKGFTTERAISSPAWLAGPGVEPGTFDGMLYLEDLHGLLQSVVSGPVQIPRGRDELVRACYPGNHDLAPGDAVFGLTARCDRYKLDHFTRDVLEDDNSSLRITSRLADFPTRLAGETRMYDLQNDPFELVDVSGDPTLKSEKTRLMMLIENLMGEL